MITQIESKTKEQITQEDIQKFYDYVKNNINNGEIVSHLEACVRCGLCAEACQFYISQNLAGEPRPELVPAYKGDLLRDIYRENYTILGRLKKAFGFGVKITPDKLIEQSMIAFDACSNCDRCARICPMGIETPIFTALLRGALTEAGVVPPDLAQAVNAAVQVGSPFGIPVDQFIGAIQKVSQEHNVEIPIDKKGAEYILMYTSLDIATDLNMVAAEAKILNAAGLNWTISTKAREGSNLGAFVGRKEIMKELASRVFKGAKELGASKIIISECGHGYYVYRFVVPNLIPEWDLEVYQMVELTDRLMKEGKIKVKRKVLSEPVSLHDGCQIGRRGGIIDESRNLLKAVVEDYREAVDSAKPERNFCCGGGGGIVINKRAHDNMEKAFFIKIEQFDKVGTKHIVTECANCHFVVSNDIKSFNRPFKVHGVSELVAQAIEGGEQ